KVCGSGLKAVMLAAQALRCGDAEIVIAGGQENMSAAPHVLPGSRDGFRMGDAKLVDTMIVDGLWDVFNQYHMGTTAENVAKQYGISRAQQDEFSVASQNKAEAAQKAGMFKDEIVPVMIPQRKGDPLAFAADEFIKSGTTLESISSLRPAFAKDGSVTAANASGINDGAAGVVVMSAERAAKLGLKPMAKIKAFASSGVDPSIMGMGPVSASRRCLEKAGWKPADLDLMEINEAFAAQACAVNKEMGWDTSKINVNGGAIDVDLARVPTHFLVDRAGLRRERLVDFHEIEVCRLPARLFETAPRGRHRPHPHDRWVDPGRRERLDLRHRLETELRRALGAHDHDAGRTVVDARCVGGSHRSVLGKCRPQAADRLQRGPRLDEFVGGEGEWVALALRNHHRDDLVLEHSRFLRGFGLVLARDREFVLLSPRNTVLFGDIFRGGPHVILIEDIPQTVNDHRIDELGVAHPESIARSGQHVGSGAHVLLPACNDDLGIAAAQSLRREHDRFES